MGGWLVLTASLFVIGLLCLPLLPTEQVGLMFDDTLYLATAKALATGQGYTVASVVGNPAMVRYPVGVSALLAPLWWLFPSFPGNLPWFAGLNLLMSLAGLGVFAAYFHVEKGLAFWRSWLIAVLVASGFSFLFLGTLILSEGPYLLFSAGLLWAGDRLLRTGRGWGWVWVLSVALFHVRAVGITLIAALAVLLWLKGQRRPAVQYAVGSALLTLLPWGLWVKGHSIAQMTLAQAMVWNPISDYGSAFAVLWAQNRYWDAVINSVGGMITAVSEQLFPILTNAIAFFQVSDPGWEAGVFLAAVLGRYAVSGLFLMMAVQGLMRRQVPSLPVLYLLFYLALIVLWGFEDQMLRFVLVVLPVFWWLLLRSMKAPVAVGVVAVLALLPAGQVFGWVGGQAAQPAGNGERRDAPPVARVPTDLRLFKFAAGQAGPGGLFV
jgi:hypothetical protein